MEEVTLEEWVQETQDEIERFRAYYRAQQEAHGKEIWPDKMLWGDWFEQLIAFGEIEQTD